MENTPEEFDDALSLCDLPLSDQEFESNEFSDSSSSQEFFEFSTSSGQSQSISTADDIIFCGKIISNKRRLAEENKKSLLLTSYSSANDSSARRTQSFRCPSSAKSSRKHKVMIGLARIPSKMELSDLRERQNRRNPPPMFPASVGSDDKMAITGGTGSSRKSRSWDLLRHFRWRTQEVGRMLPRASLGRLSLARLCID